MAHRPLGPPRPGIHPALELGSDTMFLSTSHTCLGSSTPQCLWGIFPPITDNELLLYAIKEDDFRASFISSEPRAVFCNKPTDHSPPVVSLPSSGNQDNKLAVDGLP